MNDEILSRLTAEAKKHGARAIIAHDSGGVTFLRAPTMKEFDEMASYKDTPEENNAYDRYVQACVVGSYDSEGAPLSHEQVKEKEGVLFFISGCGHAINQLAGAGAKKATFL